MIKVIDVKGLRSWTWVAQGDGESGVYVPGSGGIAELGFTRAQAIMRIKRASSTVEQLLFVMTGSYGIYDCVWKRDSSSLTLAEFLDTIDQLEPSVKQADTASDERPMVAITEVDKDTYVCGYASNADSERHADTMTEDAWIEWVRSAMREGIEVRVGLK